MAAFHYAETHGVPVGGFDGSINEPAPSGHASMRSNMDRPARADGGETREPSSPELHSRAAPRNEPRHVALDVYQEILKHRPNDVEALFQTAWSEKKAGLLQEAESKFLRILEMPEAVGHKARHWSYLGMGDIEFRKGNYSGASSLFKLGLSTAAGLERAHPHNLQWLRDVSVAHVRLGDTWKAMERTDEAIADYELALKIRERILEQDQFVRQSQVDFSVVNERLGDALSNAEQAQGYYRASLYVCEQMVVESPESLESRLALATILAKIGLREGNVNAGLVFLRRAEHIMKLPIEIEENDAEFKKTKRWIEHEIKNMEET